MSKKNDIIILGCQRAGKTTLSNMLLKKCPNYNIFPGDALLRAFESTLPDLNITLRAPIKEKSRIFAPFISSYINSLKKNYPDQNYIVECCQMFPKDVIKEKSFQSAKIIVLGYPNASVDEIIDNIRNADLELTNSRTRLISDEVLRKSIENWILYSKFLQKQAKEYSLPFYETNDNWNVLLNQIVDELINERNYDGENR